MINQVSLKLVSLPRRIKQLIMLLADSIALPICFVLAVLLRLGASPNAQAYEQLDMVPLMGCYALAVTVLSLPLLRWAGFYRSVLGYLDFKTVVKGGAAVLVAALAVYVLAHTTGQAVFPRSAILIFWFVAFSYLMCSRYAAIMLLHQQRKLNTNAKRVAIWGAGAAGAQTVAALRNSSEYLPLCFFDADIDKLRTVVAGLNVYPVCELSQRIQQFEIEQVILAMPSASASARHDALLMLAALPAELHVLTRTLPGMTDLIDGKLEVSRLRNVDVADLLGRDAIAPDADLFAKCITGKTVFVSGAGGSIGSELCRQILSQKPAVLIAFELNEFALYTLEQELGARAAALNVGFVARLGNASDTNLLNHIFTEHRVDTVYHAAAYKHVPLVESNPCVGLNNNISATWALATAAAAHCVKHFILISTDKAVRPTNVMGASKRVAELVIQAHAAAHKETVFSMVRFGNVLGSSGSVVPKFMAQIEAGGPVTVTDPDIIRYFMLIPEAAQLVIQAGAMARGGEVFVLDMGEPVKILDLAEQTIKLSGHTIRNQANPTGDIAIEFTGLRPGEKLYEELLIGNDSQLSQHAKIMQAKEGFLPLADLEPKLQTLMTHAVNNRSQPSLKVLQELVPEFNHNKAI
jgi:FlaA1/EpsC-like NDP-sugar epimerase